MILSKDEDFVQFAIRDQDGPAVVWVRTGNVLNRALLARFARIWPLVERHLAEGERIVEVR